jgi:hypothetical protein
MTTIKYRLGTVHDLDQTISWGAAIKKKDPRKPNVLKFSTLQSTTPQLNDEIKYYSLDNTQVFGGYLQKIIDNSGYQSVEVSDYSVQLSQIKVNEVYESMSPEAIIEDIIDNYTDLTFSSSIVTGITITKIVFKDEWGIDAINKMLELFNGGYSVSILKVFSMFVSSTNTCTKDIQLGRDVLEGGWETDIQAKAEKVVVLGAIIDQRTSETLTGTNTVFYTTYKPTNTQVSGLQRTTEDIDGDYTVDEENKKITFDASQTDPVVSYTYQSQIRIELGTGKTVTLEKKYIESKLEAIKLAMEYKNRFEDGSQSSKWLKIDSDIDSYNVGDRIYVGDSKNNKSGYYEIQSVTLELPKKMLIEVGEGEDDLFDWNKETMERVKQLEKNKTDSDFVTKFDYLKSGIAVTLTTTITKLQGVISDGRILWASDTTLANDGDLISDTGIDADYAIAYDDSAIPADLFIDYLVP